MKLIVFGTGLFYEKRKREFPADAEILVFLDNNRELWGKTLDGKGIVDPENICNYSYDKVLLMSKSADEMKQQLLMLNVDKNKITTWNQLMCEFARGKFQLFCGSEAQNTKGRVLILSTPLSYSGAPITAIYAAKSLQMKGWDVVLCAKEGEARFIEEAVNDGLNVVLCPAIPYLGREELFWIKQFDVVLANTFLMMPCACEISHFRPTIWWIHECSARFETYFPDTMKEFEEYAHEVMAPYMDVVGVSPVARENFNAYFPDRIRENLSYGIPDNGTVRKREKRENGKVVFAVIGSICRRKGQKEFLEAIKKMEEQVGEPAEFWIIGKGCDNEYTREIIAAARQCKAVRMTGELSRGEMKAIYEEIDVIVCPSLEETMSIVVTEGMMYGKVCITTNKTGMADYITDGENGLICEAGDVNDLCRCIKWVLENQTQLESMSAEARRAYEQYFTLERFADRLEEAVLRVKKNYESGT